MHYTEIIAYFAWKNMGSKILEIVDVVWEKLDDIEKQMISSLYKSRYNCISVKSNLSQDQLIEEIQLTPAIELD